MSASDHDPAHIAASTDGGAHALVQRFVAARRDRSLAVLEGHHPLKHALRFGAELHEVSVLRGTPRRQLPPELERSPVRRWEVDEDVFDRLVPSRPPVPVVALASRRLAAPEQVVSTAAGTVVALEAPTHHGNVGAAVRVAAAAGAGGLLVVGDLDPWHPAALRGGAGLQYAIEVAGAARLPATDRPLVAFDPEGVDLRRADAPPDPLLAFGTERRGLSDELRARADLLVRIPMRPAVSSLNLATAVAVALYAFVGARP